MDSRRDFTSKKVFSGYFSELGEKANSALISSSLYVYSRLRLFMLLEPRGILLKLHINASLSLQSSISVSDTI